MAKNRTRRGDDRGAAFFKYSDSFDKRYPTGCGSRRYQRGRSCRREERLLVDLGSRDVKPFRGDDWQGELAIDLAGCSLHSFVQLASYFGVGIPMECGTANLTCHISGGPGDCTARGELARHLPLCKRARTLSGP